MKFAKALIFFGLLISGTGTGVLAHAPVAVPLPIHHALKLTNVVLPLRHSAPPSFLNLSLLGKKPLSKTFPLVVSSGATRSFNNNIKLITETSLRNTVLNAPLSNISGQLNGSFYYATQSGFPASYSYNYSAFTPFGTNSLNNGSYSGGSVSLTNLANSFSTGLKSVNAASFKTFGFGLSGAQRSLAHLYDDAAANGYNVGISSLQHPTGGLLFGTGYFNFDGPNTSYAYPSFLAFGNNPYASSQVATNAYLHGLNLSAPLTSYLQFGKLTRLVSNGSLASTQYYPTNYIYGGGTFGAGSYYPYGRFTLAIGSNPLNSAHYGYYYSALATSTYFK